MKIELLQPIIHDGKLFSRGVHDLEERLVDRFLSLKDAMKGHAIAREFIAPEAPEGKVGLPPGALPARESEVAKPEASTKDRKKK